MTVYSSKPKRRKTPFVGGPKDGAIVLIEEGTLQHWAESNLPFDPPQMHVYQAGFVSSRSGGSHVRVMYYVGLVPSAFSSP